MRMVIPYQISTKQRKKLADDIADALNTLPRYMMYPTCNYEIGDCILDRNGKLSIPESMDEATVKKLLEHLKNRGYESDGIEEADEAQAYASFIGKLCEMAHRQKRVLASSSDGDNDKYAFRCYLLRLGFIGDEHKRSRAILLQNLGGNSAFRHPKQ